MYYNEAIMKTKLMTIPVLSYVNQAMALLKSCMVNKEDILYSM